MKKLSMIFSVITTFWLVILLIDVDDDEKQQNSSTAKYKVLPPNSVIQELLEVEKNWLELQKQADLAKEAKAKTKASKQKPKDSDKLLTIGDENYRLLGIILSGAEPFILVKSLTPVTKNSSKSTGSADIMKVTKGQELSSGYVLTELTTNKIILQGTEGTIEFKLFERRINESP